MEADIVEQALFGGGDSRFHGRRDFAGERVRDCLLYTSGYSGLTGNTAAVLNRHTKRLSLTGAADGDSVSVGENLALTLTAETYKRESADVTSNAGFVFLSGEELVSRRDGTLTFTGTGDVTFYVTYTNSRAKQTLATQPITLHVTDKSEETTVAPATATEPGTSVTEPVSGADSGTGRCV